MHPFVEVAKQALEEHIKRGKVLQPPAELSLEMQQKAGVFVSLKKDGELRGCIGSISGEKPLYQGVIDNAINSSTKDPRFPPVTKDEIKSLAIEISVLTPLKKIDKPEEIIVGRHGVYLKKGWHSAVFLPQVAPEQGWDRETMLNHLCLKAGLGPADWKTDCEFKVFSTLVFGEEEK